VAVTIVDAAQIAASNGETKRAGIIMTFASASPFLQRIPTVSIAGNSFSYTLESALPTVAFRAVNAGYTESSGKTQVRTEVLKILGGDLDVDRFHLETNGVEVRTSHEDMKARAMAQTIGYKLIKGNSGTDPLEFDGLQTRYGGLIPTLGGSAGAFDTDTRILTNATAAGAAVSMKILDQALDSVDAGIGTKVILGSQQMRRNITAYLRGSGTAIQMERDAFGNQIMSYGGATWIDADQNGNLAALAFDEGGNTTTSLYIMALGEGAVHLLQSGGGISVRDLGEQDTAPVFRTRVEWYASLTDAHPRCVTRLVNITNATAVA
jgi:hypothetical protein